MRKFIIAGNWKMNNTGTAAKELAKALVSKTGQITEVDIVINPPYTALFPTLEIIKNTNVKLGAQNMHWADKGAYTGEVSASMLTDAGCQYVILGHSERRQYFGETNDKISKKLKTAFASGLTPILCVGEILEERQSGVTEAIIKTQLIEALAEISREKAQNMIIAYEPVWAIGTGVTATPKQAQEVHAFIRNLLAEKYGQPVAEGIRIQYGGSMKPENAEELLKQKDIDGGLIGGAALKADSFASLIETAKKLTA